MSCLVVQCNHVLYMILKKKKIEAVKGSAAMRSTVVMKQQWPVGWNQTIISQWLPVYIYILKVSFLYTKNMYQKYVSYKYVG